MRRRCLRTPFTPPVTAVPVLLLFALSDPCVADLGRKGISGAVAVRFLGPPCERASERHVLAGDRPHRGVRASAVEAAGVSGRAISR